jgi:uncharacterized membrane protein (UPF0127 family)
LPIVCLVRSLLIAVVALAIVAGSAGAASRGDSTAMRLTLDGVAFHPELALTSERRARGLMNRHKAPADGMLFVFREPASGGFWMKNTLVPLTIVFFDASGKRVRRMSMVPCSDDPCAIYDPGRRYRFALELRASDRRPARKLGPLSTLRRLIGQSE